MNALDTSLPESNTERKKIMFLIVSPSVQVAYLYDQHRPKHNVDIFEGREALLQSVRHLHSTFGVQSDWMSQKMTNERSHLYGEYTVNTQGKGTYETAMASSCDHRKN